MNSIKKELSLLPLGKTIIPIEIEEEMLNKIKYLCKLIAREEWSGVLFYEPVGSIKDPKNFKIILKDVYLMDKGTAGFTSYEIDEKIIGYRMDNPGSLLWSIGHIHSHNTMPTFFSGTDTGELTDNAPHHNYYLSVVVNNWLDFSIRIAMLTESSNYVTAKDEDGETYNMVVPQTQQVVYYYNCELKLPEVEIKVPNYFSANAKRIITESDKKKKDLEAKRNQVYNASQNGNKSLAAHPSVNLAQHAQEAINDAAFEELDGMALYEAEMEAFLIELLGQNTPVILGHDVDIAIARITNGVEHEHYGEYVASMITDYTNLYTMTFTGVTEVSFIEDLDYIIQTINNNENVKHPLMMMIAQGLSKFAEEYENAV